VSELQDMLRVQARLHRKQGANALGDLFQSAALEIEILTERLENPQGLQELICVEQMKDISLPEIHRANQKLHEQLAKANERADKAERAEKIATLAAQDMNLEKSIALEKVQKLEKTLGNCADGLAKANERARELELHANSIADALGFNAENNNRFATSVICTNIRNLHSFSDCLSRIENAFLMVESETDEFGETSEDVAFSKWGLTPHEYCIEFGKWLNKFALENQAKGAEALIYAFPLNASDQMKEWVEQLRKEQEK